MEVDDLYAALLHEMKNNLALLTMTIGNLPYYGQEALDEKLDAARLLGQVTSDRLTQGLFIYKSVKNGIVLNAVNAYSPEDFIQELAQHIQSLKKKLKVSARVDPDVPEIWFFDRNMLEMALINAAHNSIAYAREQIQIRASVKDGMLAISVDDDSDGYPAHILEAVADGQPLQSSGTGLGLRFAKLIANAHENQGRCGELHLYNDNGAVFEIRVP
jgi:signal transduction histidine kinase